MPLLPAAPAPSFVETELSTSRYNLFRMIDACTQGGLSAAVGEEPCLNPQAPAPQAVVYGPGRGWWLSEEKAQAHLAKLVDPFKNGPYEAVGAERGAWVVTTGAAGLGKPSHIVGGGNKPSFHCSSFTNFAMGVYFGVEGWTHFGNIPPLDQLCSNGGFFTWRSGSSVYRNVRGYAEWLKAIEPDGTSAKQHKLRGKWVNLLMDAEELWRRRDELSEFTVAAQTSRTKTGWNYSHHTVVFIRHRDKPESLIRVAADGYKVSKSTYQPVPMDVEVIDSAEALRLENSRLYQVWTVDERTFNPWSGIIRPTLLEAASR